MSVTAEPENALDSLHVALHRDGVVPLLGAALDPSVPHLGGCLRAALAALPAEELPQLRLLALTGMWSSLVDALGPRLRPPAVWTEGVLPPIYEKLGRLPFELALTTSWRVPVAGKAGEARGPRYVPLLGTLKERASLRFLPEPPSPEIERLLARRRLWIVADSLGDADLLVLLESWASYLPPRTEEKHVILARRGTSLEQGRWRRWGFVVVLREDLETALAELARSPEVQAVPRPRLLVAGPHFGLSAEVAREVEKVWQESGAAGEDARFNTLDKLRAYDEVARQQVAALATCDVVIDFSPWRAFSRWLSRGAGDFEQEQRLEAPAQVFFVAGEGPARDRFARAAERFPDRGRRFQEVLGSQAAYSGFAEGDTAWQQDWPELVSVVVLENCEEVELGLPEYRRALQVAAGQVRLLGDALERPLQEVYVDLELEPIELGVWRGGEDEEKAGEKSAFGEKDAERREQELEEVLRSRRDRGQRPEPTRLLQPLALTGLAPRVFVLGLPGTGKTTLLKWLATRLAVEGGKVPIWVRLADLATVDTDSLVRQAIDSAQLPDMPSLRAALRRHFSGEKSDGVVLLLDGFDEANELVRTSLGDFLAKLGSHVTLILSSRPTTREAPELLRQQFRSVRLGGLLPGGAETFLRSYFGETGWISNLIRDLHRMREASAWLNTPVLLSLAAVLYGRQRELPEATLELYEAVVSELFAIAARRLRLPGERIEEARAALERFARQKLFPGAGKKADVVFARVEITDLPGSLLIKRSGLLAGGAHLRFSHLTLGEYVAARCLRKELPSNVGKAELDLEVLPMALVLAKEEALAAWWKKAAADEEPWVFLALLRALALAGPAVQSFAKGFGVQVLEEVVRRLTPASGRLGEIELELARRAEWAVWGMAKELPAGCWEVFDELAVLPGRLGFEGKILQQRAGGPMGHRLAATRMDSVRAASVLLDSGVELIQLFEMSQGEWASEVRAAAVQALASTTEARPLIQAKLDDGSVTVRAVAVQALASVPEARCLIQAKLVDKDFRVRAAAVQALASSVEAQRLIQAKLDDPSGTVRAAAVQALASVPEARHLIEAKLDDDDSDVRAAAIQALVLVPEARPLIEAKLDDDNNDVRAAAVRALAFVPEARPLIQGKLDDASVAVRSAAVQVLASVPEARPFIQAKLDANKDYRVRAVAVQALASVPEARSFIEAKLEDDFYNVRVAAVQALAFVPEARPLIQAKLDDIDRRVRAAAVQTLASVPEAHPFIEARLASDDNDDRVAAVQALASVPEAHHLIQAKLDDKDRRVRIAAVQALAFVPAARLLIEAKLDDDDNDVRAAAVQALASVPEARHLIQAKLDDGFYNVRVAAVQALASVPAAYHLIQAKLDDDFYNVRVAAVQVLASVPQARYLIQAKIDDKDYRVRAAAVQTLASAPKARHLIQAKLDDTSVTVRGAAVQALASVPEAYHLVRAKLDDKDFRVRAAAVQALTSVPEACHLIQAKLDDKDYRVRAAAVQALVAVPEARHLIQTKLDDKDYRVRAIAVQVLSSISEARHLIQAKLDDKDYRVRAAAVQALAGVPEAHHLIQARLDDDNNDVRAAAVQALASVPEARYLIQGKLSDNDNDVRVAAVQALASVPEARHLVQVKLDDRDFRVRAAAVQALRQQGLTAQETNGPNLRLVLRLSGRDPQPFLRLTREDLFLQERMASFLQTPAMLNLEKEPELGALVLDWLIIRLGWASLVADWPAEGRFFGEVRDEVNEKSRQRFVRVAMLDWDLWQERRISAFSNLFEAWRVAAYLRTRVPTTCWLLCADLDWSCFTPPELKPGEIHAGPTYYGFRLLEAEAEAVEIDLFQLAASTNARQLWQSLDETKQARFHEELAVIASRVDFTPWLLLPLVANVGDLLPQGLRATFAHKLPPSAAPTVDLLARAREALGASVTTSLPATAAATSHDSELTRRREALQQILTVRRPAVEALAAGVEHLEAMPALLAALKVPNDDVSAIYDLFDRFQDLAREKSLQERLRTALDALPAPAPSFETRRHEIRHLIDVFLKSRR